MIKNFKLQISNCKLFLLGAIFLLFSLYPNPYILSPSFAQTNNCLSQTTNPRVSNGLISSISRSASDLFGSNTGNCTITPDTFRSRIRTVPSYAELKSKYFDQSKATSKQEMSSFPTTPFSGDNLYHSAGSLSINSTTTGSGTQIFFIDGDLNINTNVSYHRADASGGLVFVVSGNVNVDPGVTEIDAVVITGGRFCSAVSADGSCSKVYRATQLNIYGSLVNLSKPPQLVRSLTDNSTPAEVINFQPKYFILLKNLFTETVKISAEITDFTYNQPGGAQSGFVTADPVGYWNFNNVGDTSFGTVNNATWVAGRDQTGLSFNGISSYVNIPYSTNLDIQNGAITLQGWVKLFSLSAGGTTRDQMVVVEKPDQYYLTVDPAGHIGAKFAGVTQNFVYSVRTVSTAVSATNVASDWHHIAVTYDGSNIRFYLDGVLDNTLSATGNIVADKFQRGVSIGGEGGVGRFVNGVIDEVKIYNIVTSISASAPAIDSTAPTVSINMPNTDPAIQKVVTSTALDSNGSSFTLYRAVLASSSSSCDGSTGGFVATPSSVSDSYTFSSEADNGKSICYKATDSWLNTSYTKPTTAPVAILGIDTTAPASPSLNINSGAAFSISKTVILNLSATDNTGVTGYFTAESATTSPTTSFAPCTGGALGTSNTSCWTNIVSAASFSANVGYTFDSDGISKTVYVWYKDAAGNITSTPVSKSILVDSTFPTVTPNISPVGPTTSNQTITATTSEGTLTQLILLVNQSDCSPTQTGIFVAYAATTFTLESDTGKSVCFKAVDSVGNTTYSRSAQVYIDRTNPTVSATCPASPTKLTTASINLSSNETGVTYQCKWDADVNYTACNSPATKSSLANGAHTFSAKAVDGAGNTSTTPASCSWTVDTVAPGTPIITGFPSYVNAANQTAVVISGSCTENGTVTVWVSSPNGSGPSVFPTCNTTSNPNWSTTLDLHDNTLYPNGLLTINANQTDAAGNTSATGTASTTKDNGTPTITINPNPDSTPAQSKTVGASTNKGTLNKAILASGITNCSSSTTGFVATTTASTDSTTFTLESDNGKSICYKATDTAGNSTYLRSNVISGIDTTAPILTVTGCPASPTNSTSASFTLSANETSIYSCQLDSGGYAACSSPKAYTGLSDATHTFNAKATDTAGNVSTAYVCSWTVDTTPPAQPVITVFPQYVNVANQNAVTISGTCSENARSVQVWVGSGGTNNPTCNTASSPNWSTTFNLSNNTTYPNGLLTINATQTDVAGNTSSTGTASTTKDNGAPVITTSGSLASNVYTITGSTNEGILTKSILASGITTCDGTLTFSTVSSGASGTTDTTTFNSTADNGKSICYKAVDTAGNITYTRSSVVSGIVDNIAPSGSLSITAAAGSNGGYSISRTVTLNLSASDNYGVTGYYYSESSTTPALSSFTAVTSITPYSANISYTFSSDGAKIVYVWYRDAAGNTSAVASASVTVDSIAPTIAVNALPAYITTTNFTVSGTCSDTTPSSGVSGKTITVTGATIVGTAPTCSANSSGTWSGTYTASDGILNISAALSDVAGNSVTSTAQTTTKDTVAPAVAITSFTNPVVSSNNYSLAVSGTCSDATSGVNGRGLTVWVGTGSSVAPTCSAGSWSTTIDLSNNTTYPAGSLQINAYMTDAAGNTSSTATATTQKVSPPVVTISANPTSIPPGSSTTITWSATNSPTSCTASSTNNVWVGAKAVNGNESITISTLGTYTLTLSCTNGGGSGSNSVNVSVSPFIYTIAGTGTSGYSGDGGPATSAQLAGPYHITVGPDQSIYFSDSNRVRKINTSGIITTVAGNGNSSYSGDGGLAVNAGVRPIGVVVTSGNIIYIADNINCRVRKVDTAGIITTIAGTGTCGYSGDGGLATNAQLSYSHGLALGPDGSIYVTQHTIYRVRKIDTSGIITTVAGTGVAGYSGDGGPATSAQLKSPVGLYVTSDNSLYISDQSSYTIRKVDPSGIISTIAGNGTAGFPAEGVTATATGLYNNWAQVVVAANGDVLFSNSQKTSKVSGGKIYTVAGTGSTTYNGDGISATSAGLYSPYGVAIGSDGSVYITDSGHSRVRKVK